MNTSEKDIIITSLGRIIVIGIAVLQSIIYQLIDDQMYIQSQDTITLKQIELRVSKIEMRLMSYFNEQYAKHQINSSPHYLNTGQELMKSIKNKNVKELTLQDAQMLLRHTPKVKD